MEIIIASFQKSDHPGWLPVPVNPYSPLHPNALPSRCLLNFSTVLRVSLRLSVLLLFSVAPLIAAAATLYVDASVTTSGTGASWNSAKATITEAVELAEAGTEIWVKAGIYTENITMKEGLKIYGGFNGSETSVEERDIVHNPTIIRGNQVPDYEMPVFLFWRINNTCLDGFFISGGRDSGLTYRYCDSIGNVIRNCILIGNSSETSGGGIIIDSDYNPEMINCIVTSNTARLNGGGLACGTYYGTWNWGYIKDSMIVGNRALTGGGIVSWSVLLNMRNCIVSHNRVPEFSKGGGMMQYYSYASIVNCLFNENRAGRGSAWISDGDSDVTFINTIISNHPTIPIYEQQSHYSNDPDGEGEGYWVPDSDAWVINCLFYNIPQGLFFDEGKTTYTTISALQAAVNNIDWCVRGNPNFKMGPAGIWTKAGEYVAARERTMLTDTQAHLSPGALAGMLIELDREDCRVGYIMANTATTIEIFGNMTPYCAAGRPYRVLDFHTATGSAAIDRGTPRYPNTDDDAPSTDLNGNPRPVDVIPYGADGPRYDIGPYEYQPKNGLLAVWTCYE